MESLWKGVTEAVQYVECISPKDVPGRPEDTSVSHRTYKQNADIKSALRSRFIGFMKRLASSRKSVLRHAFKVFSKDCRSTTGANLRNILLESGALLFEQLSMSDIKRIEFHPTPAEEQWRISVINDLIDIRDGMDDDIGWTKDDIDETLEYLCTT